MSRFSVISILLAMSTVSACSKALTESSAPSVAQKWIDSQNGGTVSTSINSLTTQLEKEMVEPWSAPDVDRLIKLGYIEQKKVSVSYPNFSGVYSGVHHEVNMFGISVSTPSLDTLEIQTLNDTRPPHVAGRFTTCFERMCDVASVTGSVVRNGPSTLTLAFEEQRGGGLSNRPSTRDSLVISLERGPSDGIAGRYLNIPERGIARPIYVRASRVGPNPPDLQQDVFVYSWTTKLPGDSFTGPQFKLGRLVVESCDHLLLASETTATASCKTHVKLSPAAEAVFGDRPTTQLVQASFGKQPDGTWIGTGLTYTAPPFVLVAPASVPSTLTVKSSTGPGATAELSKEGPRPQAAGQVAHVPVTASNAAPPPRAAINLTIFSSTPSFIVGCSSTFSKSREDFLASRYVYADDLGAQSMISIAGRPLILKAVSKPDPAYFSQFADEEYTVSIKIGKTAPGQRGAETVEGTLTVQRKNGPTVTIAVYGERGC